MADTPDSPLTTAQNFLTNNEKQLGSLVYVLGFAALGVGAWVFQAAIFSAISFGISLIGGTIALAIAAVIAFWVWMTITNPTFWIEMRMLNYQFVRWTSDRLMKSNPFGRMRAFANEFLQAQWEKFNTATVRVEAQKIEIARKLEKDKETLKDSELQTAALQRHQQLDGSWVNEEFHDKFRLEAKRILLLEDVIKKGEARLQRLTLLVSVLDKWRNTFRFEIEMTRMTADYLEQDFNAADGTTSALESASSAFGNGGAAQADKNVRAYIEKLTSDRIARGDVLMKQIPELTAMGDLKGDIAEEEIIRRLKNLDNDAQKALVEVQEDHRHIKIGGAEPVVRAKESAPSRSFLK